MSGDHPVKVITPRGAPRPGIGTSQNLANSAPFDIEAAYLGAGRPVDGTFVRSPACGLGPWESR
jgi:hypothetical protein